MAPRRFFVVGVALVLLAAACGDDASSEPAQTTTTTVATTTEATTSTITTTTTTPPGPSIVAIFDGETCTYDGPEQVSATQIISLSLTNQSDLTALLTVGPPWSEALEEIRPLIGSDVGELDFRPGQPAAELQVEPGETTEQNIILPPGTWFVVCETVPRDGHVWLAGILEVGDGDEEKVAYRSIQEFAENLRQGDMEAAAAFLGPGIEFFDIDFWESVAILDKPEFTDCTVLNETADGSEINCNLVIGEDSWTSLVMGEQAPTVFWAAVDTDGVLTRISSRSPPGGTQAELDFREWIRASHPEDEDRMFGNDYAEVFRYGKESAELHMHYLDEYLAYLETNE